MEKITDYKIDIIDGEYYGNWSGYNLEILNTTVTTTIGVKGINCEVIVKVIDGIVYW